MTSGCNATSRARGPSSIGPPPGGITFLGYLRRLPAVGGNLETVGRTEEILGRWLEGRRHDFVVATKCFGAMSARPWDQGLSRKHILDAIEGRCGGSGPTTWTSISSIIPTRSRRSTRACRHSTTLVRAGKARYVGCSNFFAYQVARAPRAK